jgi:hypothetical protein
MLLANEFVETLRPIPPRYDDIVGSAARFVVGSAARFVVGSAASSIVRISVTLGGSILTHGVPNDD